MYRPVHICIDLSMNSCVYRVTGWKNNSRCHACYYMRSAYSTRPVGIQSSIAIKTPSINSTVSHVRAYFVFKALIAAFEDVLVETFRDFCCFCRRQSTQFVPFLSSCRRVTVMLAWLVAWHTHHQLALLQLQQQLTKTIQTVLCDSSDWPMTSCINARLSSGPSVFAYMSALRSSCIAYNFPSFACSVEQKRPRADRLQYFRLKNAWGCLDSA
jgi:hypothetical protein